MRNFAIVRRALVGLSLALTVGLMMQSKAVAVTIDPVTATDGPAGDYYTSTQLINSSGLFGGGNDIEKLHDNDGGGSTMWITFQGPVAGEQVTFDLGGTYNLEGTYIWAYNQAGFTSRGVRDFTIDVSTNNGGTFNPIAGTFTVAQGSGLNGQSAQFLPFLASGVTNVRFDVLTSWGDSIVGLSEVRFTNLAPEPTSATALIVGLASLCHRRRIAR